MPPLEELSLLTLRVLSDFTEYVASRKSEVAHGMQTPELAALQIEHYGYGLAKALSIAENLFNIPSSGMVSFVDRVVLEINPTAASIPRS